MGTLRDICCAAIAMQEYLICIQLLHFSNLLWTPIVSGKKGDSKSTWWQQISKSFTYFVFHYTSCPVPLLWIFGGYARGPNEAWISSNMQWEAWESFFLWYFWACTGYIFSEYTYTYYTVACCINSSSAFEYTFSIEHAFCCCFSI